MYVIAWILYTSVVKYRVSIYGHRYYISMRTSSIESPWVKPNGRYGYREAETRQTELDTLGSR